MCILLKDKWEQANTAGAVIRREGFNGTMKQAHKTQKTIKTMWACPEPKKDCNVKSCNMKTARCKIARDVKTRAM
jgi:hypothetical protein